jgi:hypothetical protein
MICYSLLYGAEDPSIAGMVLDSAFTNLYGLMLELVDVYKIRVPKFTVCASPADSASPPLINDHGNAGRGIAIILGNRDLIIVVLPCSLPNTMLSYSTIAVQWHVSDHTLSKSGFFYPAPRLSSSLQLWLRNDSIVCHFMMLRLYKNFKLCN